MGDLQQFHTKGVQQADDMTLLVIDVLGVDLSLLELIEKILRPVIQVLYRRIYCDALNRGMRTFHIYGLSGTGKTYLFRSG